MERAEETRGQVPRLGAWVEPGRPGSGGASGRPATAGGGRAVRRGRPGRASRCPWSRRGGGASRRRSRATARARSTSCAWTARAPSRTRGRAPSPLGVHGPSEVVEPDFDWTDAALEGRRRPRRSSSTRCTSAPPRPRAPSRRSIPQPPAARELGVTAIELMPVAAFPGRCATGATTACRSFAPARRLRRPGRADAPRRRRARARPRGDPRRRLQPLRPRRELPARRTRRTTSPRRHHTPWGDADQLRRRGQRARCASFFVDNAATGFATTTSTACASTRRTPSSTTARAHLLAELAERAARRGAGPPRAS